MLPSPFFSASSGPPCSGICRFHWALEICGGGGCFCIAIDENNVCPAFKNGRCLIYNVRPDVCRLYPFYFDNFSGLFVHKDCPADFSFELETNKLEILELIKKRVNFFIDMERNKNKK